MTMKWTKRVLLMGAVALATAACGSTARDTTDANVDEAISVGGELPIADASGADNVVVVGACAEGEPLCGDTAVVPNEGTDLPAVADGELMVDPPPIDPQPEPDAAEPVSSGTLANGGLTVSAALAAGESGVLAVQGHLFDDGSGPRLCEGLQGGGERYACGGANVKVKDLDSKLFTAVLVYHEGLAYTEETVVLFGTLDSGLLTIDGLVAG
jgi:hypothetical protein